MLIKGHLGRVVLSQPSLCTTALLRNLPLDHRDDECLLWAPSCRMTSKSEWQQTGGKLTVPEVMATFRSQRQVQTETGLLTNA